MAILNPIPTSNNNTNASNINAGLLGPQYGGTGVNNGSKTIALSGTSNLTLTLTAATNVTLPVNGTLATTTNLASYLSLSGGTLTGQLTGPGGNTFDDGNGNMTTVGILSFHDGQINNQSGNINLIDSGSNTVVWSNGILDLSNDTGTADNNGFGGILCCNITAANGNGLQFEDGEGSGVYVSGSVFLFANGNSVTTQNNTLDNGNGNMVVAGDLTFGGYLNLPNSATLSVDRSSGILFTDSVGDSMSWNTQDGQGLDLAGASLSNLNLVIFLNGDGGAIQNCNALQMLSGGLIEFGDSTTQTTAYIPNTVRSKTAAYSIAVADSIILVSNTSATAYSVTLPTAAGITGKQFTIKKTDANTHTIIVATTSSQTIDGSTTYALSAQYTYVTVVSDGTHWQIIANGTA